MNFARKVLKKVPLFLTKCSYDIEHLLLKEQRKKFKIASSFTALKKPIV